MAGSTDIATLNLRCACVEPLWIACWGAILWILQPKINKKVIRFEPFLAARDHGDDVFQLWYCMKQWTLLGRVRIARQRRGNENPANYKAWNFLKFYKIISHHYHTNFTFNRCLPPCSTPSVTLRSTIFRKVTITV